MAKPFSLQIFLPFGEPAGLRIIDRANWTGQGIAFPRGRVKQALAAEELERTGVYILWNRDEALPAPQAYIGQGERVGERIRSHEREKDFWTDAVAFTTKDDSLNRAHVLYLESRLVQIAAGAGRCALENGNTPLLPNIGQAATADTERYLDDLLDCLPIIGVRFFEAASATAGESGVPDDAVELFFKGNKGLTARAYQTASGFVVRKGSYASVNQAPKLPKHFPGYAAARQLLVEQGVLVKSTTLPDAYEFTRDYEFSSPTAAETVIKGQAAYGRKAWADEHGRTLIDLAELDEDGAQ